MKRSVLAAVVTAAGLLALAGCGDSSSSSNCEAWCDKELECEGTSRPFCLALCNGAVEASATISSGCEDALNSVLSCASVLTCVEYQSWQEELPPESYPCRAEDIQCQDECGEDFCDAEVEL